MKTIVHIDLSDEQRARIAKARLGKKSHTAVTRAWLTEQITEFVKSLLKEPPQQPTATPEPSLDNPDIVRPFSRDLLRRYYAFLSDKEKERLWRRAVGIEEEDVADEEKPEE